MIIKASEFLTKSVFTPEYLYLMARIIDLRKQAGMTQAELAIRLRRPQSFVSKYERGERRLDVVEFLAVIHALGANAVGLVTELEKRQAGQITQNSDSACPTQLGTVPSKRQR